MYQWLSGPAGMVVSANGNKLFFCADQNVLELDSRDGWTTLHMCKASLNFSLPNNKFYVMWISPQLKIQQCKPNNLLTGTELFTAQNYSRHRSWSGPFRWAGVRPSDLWCVAGMWPSDLWQPLFCSLLAPWCSTTSWPGAWLCCSAWRGRSCSTTRPCPGKPGHPVM